MAPPSKTKEWTPEQIPDAIPTKGGRVFTCVLDDKSRPSAIPGAPGALTGKKCIVILLK